MFFTPSIALYKIKLLEARRVSNSCGDFSSYFTWLLDSAWNKTCFPSSYANSRHFVSSKTTASITFRFLARTL